MKKRMIILSIFCIFCIFSSLLYADNSSYSINNGYDNYLDYHFIPYSLENDTNIPLQDDLIGDYNKFSGEGKYSEALNSLSGRDKRRYVDSLTLNSVSGFSNIVNSPGTGYGAGIIGPAYNMSVNNLNNIWGTGLSSGMLTGISSIYSNYGSIQFPFNFINSGLNQFSSFIFPGGTNILSPLAALTNPYGSYFSTSIAGNLGYQSGVSIMPYQSIIPITAYQTLNTSAGLYSGSVGLNAPNSISLGYQGSNMYSGMNFSTIAGYGSVISSPYSQSSSSILGGGSYTPGVSNYGAAYGLSTGYGGGMYTYSSYGYAGGYSGGSGGTNIGYSTGGAKDINNFRQNIENNYLPLVTDITYEGLYYDYYFDTGQQEECFELFCPSYNLAVSRDPFSELVEFFMSVGLNSGIKESDFQRKKLNLVIVLDISGSMGATFSKYYYDRFGNQQELEQGDDEGKSKIQIATESVVALIDHLNLDDRFGLVTFESKANVYVPLQSVGQMDIQQIKNDILEIDDRGGTALSEGMKKGTQLFDGYHNIDFSVYENRIIFITDMMPNIGDTSKTGLLGMLSDNANKKLYTTFIGVGVDFNTELVEYITKVRGANYYSVHSSTQFKERMDDQFEFMVTPLVFNLELNLQSLGYEIAKVYGSPEANEATGELMKVKTLFPSETVEEGVKGGIVLLHLRKLPDIEEGVGEQVDPTELVLSVSYEDRLGNVHEGEKIIHFADLEPEYFDNNGIRKALLLARYANMIKNWIFDERMSLKEDSVIVTSVTYDNGITIPICAPTVLGEWERQSVDLQVSDEYKQLFSEFKPYFEAEMAAIGDEDLAKEVAILDKLITYVPE